MAIHNAPVVRIDFPPTPIEHHVWIALKSIVSALNVLTILLATNVNLIFPPASMEEHATNAIGSVLAA